MNINYDDLPRGEGDMVRFLENKPHIKYIRYLLSKKMPLCPLREELWRLGFSAPGFEHLKTYFLQVIWPLAQELGITQYYEDYYKRMADIDTSQKLLPILTFELTFEKDEAARINFCTLVRKLEIEEMWSKEITRYYGGIQNIPQNESGERVIKTSSARNIESILTCPKRYLIDKLLIEDVPVHRIVGYMKEKHGTHIEEASLYSYAKYFFNFERHSIEKMLDQLISEKRSIESEAEILNKNDELSLGDKISIAKQFDERIKFLDNSIKELTARYSDLSYVQGVNEKLEIKGMIEDIVARGYRRFQQLDRQPDRDVVKPITDISKMIFSAVEKLQTIDDIELKRRSSAMDKSVSEIMLEQYKESFDRSVSDGEIRVAGQEVDIQSIEGMDEN